MRSDPQSGLRVELYGAHDYTALTMTGVLDGTTYRAARDAVLKAATDEPPMVVVDVTRLRAPAPSAWSVFTSAHWLISEWPNVPMGLVCAHKEGRETLARNGLTRYLPLFSALRLAIGGLSCNVAVPRKRVRQQWPSSPATLPATREFVSHWLDVWGLAPMIPTATVVTTALVDNVLTHTDSAPDVRLETDGVTVTVAVTDDSTTPAAVREDVDSAGALSELMIVKALTIKWGNTPTDVGKTVWAVMGPGNQI